MIQMLDPQRHELALLQEAFLNKGGTIEVLQGPSFVPPPVRHDPPPTVKAKPAKQAAEPGRVDKLTQRDIEREERAAQAAKDKHELTERIRKLAETMNYSQAILRTGLARRTLYKIAKDGGFTFQPAAFKSQGNLRRATVDEAKDAKDAERIKAFKEIGLTRNQAMEKTGISFTAFIRILTKFEIDYPKSARGGPRPVFIAKAKKQ
jgi:DNA invertase Pin-like site-specific DNA recombinase